jgi:hypothetical protein
MMNWEEFIATEEAKGLEARQKIQEAIDAFGIPLDRLQELAAIDLQGVDPELLQQLELSTGLKITQMEHLKPKKDASTYRQRGRGIAV